MAVNRVRHGFLILIHWPSCSLLMRMKTQGQIDVCEMTSGSIKFMTGILEAVESKMAWINAKIKQLDLHAQESKNTACKYMLTTIKSCKLIGLFQL